MGERYVFYFQKANEEGIDIIFCLPQHGLHLISSLRNREDPISKKLVCECDKNPGHHTNGNLIFVDDDLVRTLIASFKENKEKDEKQEG